MSYEQKTGKDAAPGNRFVGTDGRIGILEPYVPDVQAAELQEFTITQDSVVVTVILRPAPEHRAVQINWGDDTVDFVDFLQPDAMFGSTVPEGSYKRQHVYQRNPVNGFYPNRVNIILAIYHHDGSRTFDGRGIDLEPRFRCSIYPVLVRANHHDTGTEEHSEFDITMKYQQSGSALLDKQWRWEPKTLDIGFGSNTLINAETYLEGSQFFTEISFKDDPILISHNYVDDDGAWGLVRDLLPIVEFDGSTYLLLVIHPSEQEGYFEVTRHMASDSGWMDFEFRISLDLIVPLDQGPLSVLNSP